MAYNAEDVMCKIIPLYKVTIHYEEKDEYDDIIVADTIEGVVHGLVDIEMNREEWNGTGIEKFCKTFDITDFLYMPCAGAKRGFHLFDIEDVDCAEWYGATIDGTIYYRCYFVGDKCHGPPETLQNPQEADAFAEPRAVTNTSHQPREQPSDFDKVMREYDEREAVMEVLYDLSKVHPYRGERVAEREKEKSKLYSEAEERVRQWVAKGE